MFTPTNSQKEPEEEEESGTLVTFTINDELFKDVSAFGKEHATDHDYFEIGAKLMMDFWTPQSGDLDLEG